MYRERLTQVEANRWREFNMREVHKQNVEEKGVDNEIQCEPKDEVKIKVLVAQSCLTLL